VSLSARPTLRLHSVDPVGRRLPDATFTWGRIRYALPHVARVAARTLVLPRRLADVDPARGCGTPVCTCARVLSAGHDAPEGAIFVDLDAASPVDEFLVALSLALQPAHGVASTEVIALADALLQAVQHGDWLFLLPFSSIVGLRGDGRRVRIVR
jgi:hypothetical protein